MSLEQVYWAAGIIGVAFAVFAFFRKAANRPTMFNRQDANVSGQNNSINQTSSNESKGQSDPK